MSWIKYINYLRDLTLIMETLFITNLIQSLHWNSQENLNLLNILQHVLWVEPGEGLNRSKLYEELGWEYLYHRRWYRHFTHFFKLRQSESPQYLYNLVPPVLEVKYELRRPHVFEQRTERTNRFSNKYFQNCPYEWNQLDLSIQSCQNISEFKRKLIQLVRPPKNSIVLIRRVYALQAWRTMNISSCTAHALLCNVETFLTWFLACLTLKLRAFLQKSCLTYYSLAIQILR